MAAEVHVIDLMLFVLLVWVGWRALASADYVQLVVPLALLCVDLWLERRRVLARLVPVPTRLNAHKLHLVVIDKRIKESNARSIDRRDKHIRQLRQQPQ